MSSSPLLGDKIHLRSGLLEFHLLVTARFGDAECISGLLDHAFALYCVSFRSLSFLHDLDDARKSKRR